MSDASAHTTPAGGQGAANSSLSTPAPQNLAHGAEGVSLTHMECTFLKLLAVEVRSGEFSQKSENHLQLMSTAKLMGLKDREVLFLFGAFSQGGIDTDEFSDREIGRLMRRRQVSRLVEWGYGEGVCDNGRMGEGEFESWLARLMRDEGAEWAKRKWAGEMWAQLRKAEGKGSSCGGTTVQIVIANPYGGAEVKAHASMPEAEVVK